MVRAVPVAPRAAAIENPRLMIALIAVIDAQKMNGTVIRNSCNFGGRDQVSRKSHSLPITQRRAPSLPFVIRIRNRSPRWIFLLWYGWLGSNHRPPVPQNYL